MRVLVLLLALSCAGPVPHVSNFLQVPDFESTVFTPGPDPPPWENELNQGPGGAVVVTSPVHSGTKAIKLIAQNVQVSVNYYPQTQPADIPAGTTLYFGGWVRQLDQPTPLGITAWVGDGSEGFGSVAAFPDGHIEVGPGTMLIAPLPTGNDFLPGFIRIIASFETTAPTPLINFSISKDAQIGPAVWGWVVDDVWFGDTPSIVGSTMSAISKWNAYQALMARVKTITGEAAGYWINLDGRVYPVWMGPAENPELELPYACMPLQGETTVYRVSGPGFIEREWTWNLNFFVDELMMDPMDTSQVELVTKLEDDLVRALTEGWDWTLGGAVHDLNFGEPEAVGGARLGGRDYGELVFPIRLTQRFQRSELGPQGA